jgi:hypothetical protein
VFHFLPTGVVVKYRSPIFASTIPKA